MKSYVIALRGHEYSERVASRCIQSGSAIGGIGIERFDAIPKASALSTMRNVGLRWTWGPGYKNLKHHEYGGAVEPRIGCALSHYLLWRMCSFLGDPILILEHDAVFLRRMPNLDFSGVCQINDPRGATPRGAWWSDQMASRGLGVFPKTRVLPDDRPDGLAGNSAYVIHPHAAETMVQLAHDVGLWPNDALMCRQLIDLEEAFPFVTEVRQEQSTSGA